MWDSQKTSHKSLRSIRFQLYWNFPKLLCLSVESTEAAPSNRQTHTMTIAQNSQKQKKFANTKSKRSTRPATTIHMNSHIWPNFNRKGQIKRIQRFNIYKYTCVCDDHRQCQQRTPNFGNVKDKWNTMQVHVIVRLSLVDVIVARYWCCC